jgi:hypothetical protein
MSGQVIVDGKTAENAVPLGKYVVLVKGHRANAMAGWCILPSVALGATFWALVILWVFGFG